MSDTLSAEDIKKIADLETKVRESEERVKDMEDAMEGMYAGLMNLEKSLKGLFLSSISSQIMEETITRYMAGYEQGDYTKEIEMAQNGDAKSPSEFKLLIKDKGFDQARFNALAEEIGRLMIEMRSKAAQEAAAKKAVPAGPTLIGLDGKPLNKDSKPNLRVL